MTSLDVITQAEIISSIRDFRTQTGASEPAYVRSG